MSMFSPSCARLAAACARLKKQLHRPSDKSDDYREILGKKIYAPYIVLGSITFAAWEGFLLRGLLREIRRRKEESEDGTLGIPRWKFVAPVVLDSTFWGITLGYMVRHKRFPPWMRQS